MAFIPYAVGVILSAPEPLWGGHCGTLTTRGFAEVANELGPANLIQLRRALISLYDALRIKE